MASRVWQSVRRNGSENYSWDSVDSWDPACGCVVWTGQGAKNCSEKGRTTGSKKEQIGWQMSERWMTDDDGCVWQQMGAKVQVESGKFVGDMRVDNVMVQNSTAASFHFAILNPPDCIGTSTE